MLLPAMSQLTAEDLNVLTSAIAQTIVQAQTPLFTQLIEGMKSTNPKGNRIDHKSIGGPPDWDSSREEGFLEWKLKMEAWLTNQDERASVWLKEARDRVDKIETEELERITDEKEKEGCKKFNTVLNQILVTKLKGEAFNIVTSVRDSCGLEAWRLIMKRYEPRTPGTKRALLKTIFNMKAAKKVEEIEKNVLKLEEIYNRYESMSKNELPEDIKTVIMIELCTPDLKEHLEFNLKDVEYKEAREAVMAYVERKRRDPLTAMEIGSHENEFHDDSSDWWGCTDSLNCNANHGECEYEVNYYGYKGKGPSFPTKGKGKGPGKAGGKSWGPYKGGGKDKGGKSKGGKKGEFQGSCHWCGKWGHTANRCTDKDEYMDWVRSGKGAGSYTQNDGKGANSVETEIGQMDEWSRGVEALSAMDIPSRRVDIGHLSKNYGKHFPKLHNRFDALSEEHDEDEPKKAPNRRWGNKCEINSYERVEKEVMVDYVHDDQFVEVTIDSGAGENVMSENMAPRVPVQHSSEQDAGVVYVAANGDTMPNRGKKVLHVVTKEGQSRRMNMQVTDVNKALMSVAKICDAGHTVTFRNDGGTIRNNRSGEVTTFRRENNVYRMKVKLDDSGFARQG